MKSLLYKLLFTFICAAFSLNSFADNQKTMWDVIADSRFATFAVMVEKAGVENLLMGK